MKLRHASKFPKPDSNKLFVVLVSEHNLAAADQFVTKHLDRMVRLEKQHADKGIQLIRIDGKTNVIVVGTGQHSDTREGLRRATATATAFANDHHYNELVVALADGGSPKHAAGEAKGAADAGTGKGRKDAKPSQWSSGDLAEAVAESIYLSNYQFLLYKSKKDPNTLQEATIVTGNKEDAVRVARAAQVARAVELARDLVNEPVITLGAEALADRAVALGKEYGFKVEVFNKQKIQTLKMGGLLAVNAGSIEPPTFTVMEYKPKKANNAKPIVLVGKGVVFDTGGLSLKPTPNSMDQMKSDMAGAAAVIGAMCALTALEVPVHVVGLVPATDNRPGEHAYTPGDVIRMFDGSTVEVLNTDAEGRMILADALAYAKKYKPELVIELSTLTGAQITAVGHQGCAMMGTAPAETKAALQQAGQRMYERAVELPLWDEYKEQLKSDIADMKNIGGSAAGCITAGKFLEQFTDYPFIHLDIAGPSFLPSSDAYRPKNGTGFGVRLLTEFLHARYGALDA